MTTLPFATPNRSGNAWFSVGNASSFPNITDSGTVTLSEPESCGSRAGDDAVGSVSRCKVFIAPGSDTLVSADARLLECVDDQIAAGLRVGDQVLVFQYKSRFHAVDNKCPHASYPLSNGTPFDIEDFGIALSAGITCPKHGWSFDLWTGNADRGGYQLKRWEVQLRPTAGGIEEQEVWVRRRSKRG